MWKQFYLSSDFDLLMFVLMILIVVVGIIGSLLLSFYLYERKKQTKLMKEIQDLFMQLSQMTGGPKMNFDLEKILSGHQAVANPTQTSATSQDIAKGLQSLTNIGSALAGNLGRIAVNTSLDKEIGNLGGLNAQVAEFAEVLATKTSAKGQEASSVALGNQNADALPSEQSPEKSTSNQLEEPEPQTSSFSLQEAREVIRKVSPLRLCVQAHNIDINSEFDLRTPECLIKKLIEKLKARDGMVREDGEIRLLQFLESLQG